MLRKVTAAGTEEYREVKSSCEITKHVQDI
jgi:hypothetical protein